MLLVVTEEMASDPEISKHLDAAISYVGGRTETLFAGVYVKENLPGLVAILTMNGLDWYLETIYCIHWRKNGQEEKNFKQSKICFFKKNNSLGNKESRWIYWQR